MRVAQPTAPHRGRGRADGPAACPPPSGRAVGTARETGRGGPSTFRGRAASAFSPPSARPCSGVVCGEHVRVWHNE